jgi:hypothetical protein
MKVSTLIVIVVALAVAGCAGSPVKVRDEDFARLDAGQLKEVSQELGAAQDELAGAKAKITGARKELEVSKDELATAEKERDKRVEEAKAAEARFRAAQAHADHAEKVIDAREADEAAATRRVELARAKVELVKFQALEQSKAPALAEYDRGAFYERVGKTQREFDAARKDALEAEQKAQKAEREWQELARKAPVK